MCYAITWLFSAIPGVWIGVIAGFLLPVPLAWLFWRQQKMTVGTFAGLAVVAAIFIWQLLNYTFIGEFGLLALIGHVVVAGIQATAVIGIGLWRSQSV